MTTLAPWQQRILDQAVDALDSVRMGHALLICGPAGIGKRIVAERMAQHVLCTSSDRRAAPCGVCKSCTMFAARHQLDHAETRPDGSLAHPFGRPGHPDALLVGYQFNDKARPPKMRTEIVIEQIRDLSEKLALTPQYGRAQVAIVDPADAINHSACNALLKTLEEPQPGRYLWLLSAAPARLPATIRSRCQRLLLHLPPREEALAWLAQQGHKDNDAVKALDAARGHPGLAHAWLQDDGMALRREVASDLARLGKGDAAVIETAQRWVADENAAMRLSHAADLALAEAQQAGANLTDPARMRKLATWFDAANRTRDLLRTTVRADLAVAELLQAWARSRA